MSDEVLISRLEAENALLKTELDEAREKAHTAEEGRQATLYILEDLNEATADIERAKMEWEATFDGITDPLFIHDREFKVVRANVAYRDAAGAKKFKEFIGRPYYEVFPKMEGPFKMCLKAREMQEEEFSCPITNRIFKVRFYPIKDVNGGYLYSIHLLEDITEAKKAGERIKEEMDVTSHLLMISEATAHTTDIDKLIEQVVHCAHEITECDVCLSYLWDVEAKAFSPSQAFGLSHELIPLFKTESLDMKVDFVKEAMKKKGPIIIAEFGMRNAELKEEKQSAIRTLQSAFEWLPDIQALAAIPLIGRKGPLGLIVGIYVETPRRGISTEFTERDMKIMQGIMHQVSVALEQARLYKESVDKTMELSHKIETIQAMHEIDKSILSTLESQEILETVVRLVSKVIPSDRVTVALIDREKGGDVYTAGFGTSVLQKGMFVPFGDSISMEVLETGKPQYVADLAALKELPPSERLF